MINLRQYLPDAIYGIQGRLGVLEVERNPILIKRCDSAQLEQFKFLEKLNHLVHHLALPVTLLYVTQHQADKNLELCNAAAAHGYPYFSKTAAGEYWLNKTWVGDGWQHDTKPVLFRVSDIRFESLERLKLADWLP